MVRIPDDASFRSVALPTPSPPYYGLRDYGVDGQIGTEESPQAYICRLVEVFREVRRVLTDDGTLWLNIADSYAGSGNGNQSINEKRERGQECKKLTRNRRDVWNLSTNSYRMDGHFAMFPERLVEPCILAGCPVGGVVLDPFLGSGTTGAVAKRLGRQYIGIDLNPAYCRAAEDRIREIPDSGERELTEERKKDGN